MTTTIVRRVAALAGAVALAVALAACGSSGPSTAPSAVASAAASAGPISLAGTSWRLTDYVSPDGALFTVPAAITPLAEFTDTAMSGNAGCNTFNAGYKIDGDAFTLDPIASTKMACEEPIASVENAYLAALSVVDKVAILDNGKLQLWDSGGKTTLAFVQAK